MKIRDPPYESEAQPVAFRGTGLIGLVEFFKDPCLVFQSDAGSLVGDRDPDAVLLFFQPDPDRAAFRRKTHGVVDQIVPDVAEEVLAAGVFAFLQIKIQFGGEMKPFIIKSVDDDEVLQLVLPIRTYA